MRDLLRVIGRTVMILLALAAVALLCWLLLGPPRLERLYARDEIARFRPTAGHGIGQLLGEASLLALVAYAARRWFKVRL